jgi:hypothetical protein
MQRRTFSALSIGALSSLAFTGAQAQSGFKEGTDYYKLSQAVPTEAAKGHVECWSSFGTTAPTATPLNRR